ncbi:MAG: hypothetical protein CMA30_07775 [Euryarchaeota archaeon]|nr:hypothetical protein [Euryarchaeota archaeon]
MIAGVITSLLMLTTVALWITFFRRNAISKNEDFDHNQIIGQYGIEASIIGIILLWIIPWGIIFILPVLLLLSLLSPAGRETWKEFTKVRVYFVCSLLIVIFAGGFIPASEPISPDEWGEPLLKENPNAPLYPSGSQYTWVMLPSSGDDITDVEIVQSLKLRIPYQFSTLGSASSALDLADLFNMEKSRLKQAIELLDDETPLSFDSEEMLLKEVISEKKHTYIDSSSGEENKLNIALFELRSLTLSSDPDGRVVGEVLCAASDSWGGEVDIVVVVRPIGHPSLELDRFAESLVSQWVG